MLSPPRFMKFLSYITGRGGPVASEEITTACAHPDISALGWLTAIGWQAAFCSSSFLAGTEIQGVVTLAHANYEPKAWQGTLIMWASIALALMINVVGGKLLPRVETVVLVVHIVGYFGILIPLTYMADHKSNQEVFQNFVNSGGFPSDGLAFFVGMTGCVFAFAGGDAAVHVRWSLSGPATLAGPKKSSLITDGRGVWKCHGGHSPGDHV